MQQKALRMAFIGSLMMYHAERNPSLLSISSFQSKLTGYVHELNARGSLTLMPKAATVKAFFDEYCWCHLGCHPEEHDNEQGWLVIDAASSFMTAHSGYLSNP